ncbi:MAG: SDR family oxidoreductase [Myxococcota bacterium]|nr:SDR family oxidoreductase [Myxococcota bacterium]
MNRFHHKRVLIIGASKGIGYACAKMFVEESARVLLVARGEERLKAAAEFIAAEGYIAADISKQADCDFIYEESVRLLGGIDILIHNAALHHRGAVQDRTATELADMVQVNLAAPVYLSRLFLPSLIESKGVLVFVASLAGCVPLPNSTTYSATKFGLRAFSMALAQEVEGLGVGVSVVSPGPVETEFILKDLDAVSDMTFSQPMISPERVANAVLGACIRRPREVKLPRASGYLTTVGYLFPVLRRWLKPVLKRKGARAKEQIRKRINPS